jgi:hypothetical protein
MIRLFAMAGFAAAFYAWQGLGIEGAGNVLKFATWLICAIGIFGGMWMKPGSIKTPMPGRVWRWLLLVGDVAMIAAFAWVGSFGYAIAWLLSSVFMRIGMQTGRMPAKAVV